MFCEEIDHSLKTIATHGGAHLSDDLATLQSEVMAAEARVRSVQVHNTEAAAKQIKQFLPKDFRSTLLEMKQASGERKNQKAVEDLIKNGGSIRERYELYLKQASAGQGLCRFVHETTSPTPCSQPDRVCLSSPFLLAMGEKRVSGSDGEPHRSLQVIGQVSGGRHPLGDMD